MGSITKNKQTDENLVKMVKKAFGEKVQIISWEELTDGLCNVAYRIYLSNGIHTILKISPDHMVKLMACENELMQTEVKAMKLAKEKNLVPVAEVYYYDNSRTICTGEYFFMEIIEGSSLYQLEPKLSSEELSSFREQIGQVLRKLNQEKGTMFGHFCVESLQFPTWYEAFSFMLTGVCRDGNLAGVDYGMESLDILEALHKYKRCFDEVTEPAFIHYDSWNGNIFVKDNHITGLIDWERAMWADPLMEVKFNTHELNKDFLKGYGIRSLSTSQKIRCLWYDVYLYLIMMNEVTYRQYDNDDQYHWVKNLFQQSWNNLSKMG